MLGLVSLMAMVIDLRSDFLRPLRDAIAVTALPVHHAADMPRVTADVAAQVIRSKAEIQADNTRLERENLRLKGQVQKLQSEIRDALARTDVVAVEPNTGLESGADEPRLRQPRTQKPRPRIVSEIIGIDPDPFRHEVVLDKGRRHGVFEGQAVLDGEGLMGQVVRVEPLTSRVLLISDVTHGVPVHVVRNGVRAIAVGSGNLDVLQLLHVPDTADIKEGDRLETSGLGGRFPKGYPVAVVIKVEHDPGAPFARVEAKPLGQLDRSRHVVLVNAQ